MRNESSEILAGRILPIDVVLQQVPERCAISSAFTRAATRKLRVVIDERWKLLCLQEAQPRRALRGQRPQHRRAQEAVVIIVARIADGPARPRVSNTAPRRLRGIPYIEE